MSITLQSEFWISFKASFCSLLGSLSIRSTSLSGPSLVVANKTGSGLYNVAIKTLLAIFPHFGMKRLAFKMFSISLASLLAFISISIHLYNYILKEWKRCKSAARRKMMNITPPKNVKMVDGGYRLIGEAED